MKQTLENGIDFTPVSIEEAAAVTSPAARLAELEAKFNQSPSLVGMKRGSDENSERVKELLTTIESSAIDREKRIPENLIIKEDISNPRAEAEAFGDTLGIDARPRFKGDTQSAEVNIARGLSADKWGDHQNGKTYLTLGALGTVATGITATALAGPITAAGGLVAYGASLATLPLAGLGLAAFPVVASAASLGLVGYYGYKTVKNLLARRAFKKHFGKSVGDVYDLDKY